MCAGICHQTPICPWNWFGSNCRSALASPLPASSYVFIRQQIWLIEGRLDFSEGDNVHHMQPGDCLALGPPSDCIFFAPGPDPAVYLVAVVRGGR